MICAPGAFPLASRSQAPSIGSMQTILVIALILAMIATLVALVRGIIAFLQTTKEDLNRPEGSGPSPARLKQNKMMMNRILFQAAAIIIVAILLMAKGNG